LSLFFKRVLTRIYLRLERILAFVAFMSWSLKWIRIFLFFQLISLYFGFIRIWILLKRIRFLLKRIIILAICWLFVSLTCLERVTFFRNFIKRSVVKRILAFAFNTVYVKRTFVIDWHRFPKITSLEAILWFSFMTISITIRGAASFANIWLSKDIRNLSAFSEVKKVGFIFWLLRFPHRSKRILKPQRLSMLFIAYRLLSRSYRIIYWSLYGFVWKVKATQPSLRAYLASLLKKVYRISFRLFFCFFTSHITSWILIKLFCAFLLLFLSCEKIILLLLRLVNSELLATKRISLFDFIWRLKLRKLIFSCFIIIEFLNLSKIVLAWWSFFRNRLLLRWFWLCDLTWHSLSFRHIFIWR